jgi:hypothetical protein
MLNSIATGHILEIKGWGGALKKALRALCIILRDRGFKKNIYVSNILLIN